MITSGTLSNLRYPLCNKSAVDFTAIFNNIDNQIENTPIPEEYITMLKFIVTTVKEIVIMLRRLSGIEWCEKSQLNYIYI